MRQELKDVPTVFPERPSGLVSIRINKKTGERTHAGDPDAMFETFREAYAPKEPNRGNTNPNRYENDSSVGQEIYEDLF